MPLALARNTQFEQLGLGEKLLVNIVTVIVKAKLSLLAMRHILVKLIRVPVDGENEKCGTFPLSPP